MLFKKFFILALTFFLITICISCTKRSAKTSIKIGVIAGPSVQVIEIAKKIAKEKYNLEIQPVVFTDYQMTNEAVNSGDIDLSIAVTRSFLQHSIDKKGFKITAIGNTFIYPMGIYSNKIKSLTNLKL